MAHPSRDDPWLTSTMGKCDAALGRLSTSKGAHLGWRRRLGNAIGHQNFFKKKTINLEILETKIKMGNFRGVSGPGVAGNGFSSKNHYQKWGRDSNPCPGDPFRGHFPFSQNLRRRLQLELESYYSAL